MILIITFCMRLSSEPFNCVLIYFERSYSCSSVSFSVSLLIYCRLLTIKTVYSFFNFYYTLQYCSNTRRIKHTRLRLIIFPLYNAVTIHTKDAKELFINF